MAESPVTETISGLGWDFGSVATAGWYIAVGIILFGFLGVAIYFAWRQFQYKYKIHVLEEMSDGGTRIYHDKGRIVTRADKTKVFKLKYFKDAVIPIPNLESMMVGKKGGKEIFLKKFGINEFDYIPLGIYLKGLQVEIKPFPQGRKNWISTELKRVAQRHGSFWEKYGGQIMAFSTMTLALIMIIIIFKMAQDVGTSLEGVGGSISGALNSMQQSCSNTVTATNTLPPGF